jgi:hypothetical protein
MTFEKQALRGVFNHFGPRKTDSHFGGRIDIDVIKSVQWTFDYTQIGTNAGTDVIGGSTNLEFSIPANSTILSAKLQVITPWVSTSTTSDMDIGLEQADGTDIDLDGLITAAQATQTTLGVAGAIIDGASGTPGALIGKTIGAAAGELVVTPTVDDFTAGKARLIVTYIDAGL